MSICTDITLVEKLQAGDMLLVTIDNHTTAYWLYDYAESLKYVGKEVIVEYRQDIYNGALTQFIATFTIPTVVQTLDKSTGIKLYCDQIDNQSNLSFSEIAIGESRPGCIVYCTACEFKSSANAVWQELTIRDKTMHTAKLRLFDYENKAANFAGSYVMTELSRNKFGFQSEIIHPVPGDVAPNPEIAIAKQFITNYFVNDANANAYIAMYNLLEFIERSIDYEMGYGLMRLAMELSIVESMDNVSKDVDFKSISQALLAQRGYLAHESVLSKTVNNIILAMRINWDDKALVLKLLDDSCENKPSEFYVMKSIQETVNTLLEVRKGTPLDVI